MLGSILNLHDSEVAITFFFSKLRKLRLREVKLPTAGLKVGSSIDLGVRETKQSSYLLSALGCQDFGCEQLNLVHLSGKGSYWGALR